LLLLAVRVVVMTAAVAVALVVRYFSVHNLWLPIVIQ
jgi:hypothetical protein